MVLARALVGGAAASTALRLPTARPGAYLRNVWSRELELFVEPSAPVGYREAARPGTLRIHHTWRDPSTWRGTPAALPWLGVGVALGALGVRAGGDDPRASLALVGILLAWLSLTVLFAWEVLARAVNRTRIVLDAQALWVSHGPLPLAGARPLRVLRAAIASFHVEPRRDERGALAQHVVVETREGVRFSLLSVDDVERASRVRDALHAHIGGR